MTELKRPTRTLVNVPDGMQPVVLARLVEERLAAAPDATVAAVFVARDGRRLQRMDDILRAMLPGHTILTLPAWDCLPYDRVSPNGVTIAARMTTISALADPATRGAIVLTAVNALVQKLPPRDVVAGMSFAAKSGDVVDSNRLIEWASLNGYLRVPTVRETGEYAVRGGLVDLYPASLETPLRFDFFGKQLESIRTFDPDTQRTTGTMPSVALAPMSEVLLNDETIKRFRARYNAMFGGNTGDDPLYAAVSAGQRYPGVEHWLPLFYDHLDPLSGYAADAPLVFDDQALEAFADRQAQIKDYFDARAQARTAKQAGGSPYKPVPAGELYEVGAHPYGLGAGAAIQLSSFALPDEVRTEDAGGKLAHNFAAERQATDTNLFAAVVDLLKSQSRSARHTVIACFSEGSRDRMAQVLADHGLAHPRLAENWQDAVTTSSATTALVILPLESGYTAGNLTVLSEQDILGERLLRPQRRKKASDALTEATSLAAGDLVVHVDHGIGRFLGLKQIEAMGAPHDCVEIQYAGDTKLYLPVENIELLSRYGSEGGDVMLDKLGGVAWQARKAKLKKRIRDMAEQLIKVAAARQLREGPVIDAPHGVYEEFCARFPYGETEDQEKAIADVMEDLTKGRPMDRLVCGDVGFGKTEVALRAAFVVAMTGRQVAVVVPTTLLARQHYKTFTTRFQGFPVKVRQLSRMVAAKEASETRAALAAGTVDVVIGTHALLAKSIAFRDLGILIVDEEQHFGVAHKERLKQLRADVHVLTLTATPIPRTLQLALSGVKEMSIIATPPIDRLAVRTFVTPFDPVTLREALLREHYRGGQSFYVCPRISDLGEAEEFLKATVPEVKVGIAHGQMPPTRLEDIMSAFYDGKFDVLLSTPIVESGLDIPTANTMIVHRSNIFGLAQLYQLRGRIGRSKARAYAYFTVPADRKLTDNADRRLKVLQALDTLGAGFSLASHDLDIRGAGNLLGEEQSGEVREVGIELYQDMLEEAVASLRGSEPERDETWSPQINLGSTVLIPESYVADLNVRLALYRRLSTLETDEAIDAFAAELIDRFGPLPAEVNTLLKIMSIKRLCRVAQVEKIDAGPKGATISFRNNAFPEPAKLIAWIAQNAKWAKVRPDQKLVIMRDWASAEERLTGAGQVLARLAEMAG
jgi:transcription-repair coupling factor (superfamily II helicase)